MSNPYGQSPYGSPQDPNNTPYGSPQNPYNMQQPPYNMQAQSNQIDVGESLSQAWKRFSQNLGPWIGSLVVYMLAIMVLVVIPIVPMFVKAVSAPVDAYGQSTYTPGAPEIILAIVLMIPLIILSIIFDLNMKRNALAEFEGQKATFGSFFRVQGLATPFWVSLVVGIIEIIGTLLLLLPGLVASIFLAFAVYASFEEGLGVGDSMRRSVEIVKANLGSVILLLLLCWAISAVGGSIYIGVIFIGPLIALMTAFAYKRGAGRNPQVLP